MLTGKKVTKDVLPVLEVISMLAALPHDESAVKELCGWMLEVLETVETSDPAVVKLLLGITFKANPSPDLVDPLFKQIIPPDMQ